MAKSFLDYDGLAHLVSKIKSLISGSVAEGITVDATGDGATYTATASGVTSLKKGIKITIIPGTTSTTTIPKLNLNSLGAKNIKQRISINTSLTVGAANDAWMVAGKPVPLMYDGTAWVTIAPRPTADDLYGSVANTAAVELTVAGWSNYQQTVSVDIATADNKVFVSPDPADDNYAAYTESGIRCIAQAEGTLTFQCEDVPSIAVTANVAVIA